MPHVPAPPLEGRVVAVHVGPVGALRHGAREIPTAIVKAPVHGRVAIGRLGLPGDEQAYPTHGGLDRAVCVHSLEHYAYWAERLGRELPASGAFGENLTVVGLVETEVEIGDTFSVGDAVLQVSTMRDPCYKLAARFFEPEMALHMQETGRTGYFLRVVQEGSVASGDAIRLVGREGHGVTLAEANRIIDVDRDDVAGARRLLRIASLADRWRPILEKRAAGTRYGLDTARLFLE